MTDDPTKTVDALARAYAAMRNHTAPTRDDENDAREAYAAGRVARLIPAPHELIVPRRSGYDTNGLPLSGYWAR